MDKDRGIRITAAMKSNGFTRDSLAQATGYSAGTISKIKAGNEFKTDQLIAICEVLKVSPNYVLGYEEHSLQLERLIAVLKSIPDQNAVCNLEEFLTSIIKQ